MEPIYSATVSGGLEKLCCQEISEKCAQVRGGWWCQGRVFWSSDTFSISQLKLCERIFANLGVVKLQKIDQCRDSARLHINRILSKVNWATVMDLLPGISESQTSGQELKFRVQSRVSGQSRNTLTHGLIQNCVRESIQSDILLWEKKRSLCDLEIFVHWNDDRLIIGVPLGSHKVPLGIPKPGLRCSLAFAMSFVVRNFLHSDSFVLDPCAGKGTLIFEHVMNFPTGFAYICDIEDNEDCLTNLASLPPEKQSRVHILKSNVQSLPFQRKLFDLIICDPPFGVLHKIEQDLGVFYGTMLSSLFHCSKENAVAVFLITNVSFLESSFWDILKIYPVRHGRLNASIVVLKRAQRTSKKMKLI